MGKRSAGNWDDYFLMVNNTTPLPCLARALERRGRVLETYNLSPSVEQLLQPLQLATLEKTVPDKTALYALLAYHAVVCHAQGSHKEESVIYARLDIMDTADWPQRSEASFNRIRCLREQALDESDQARKVTLAQETLGLVDKTDTLLRSRYSEKEYSRSTFIRDERDFLLVASMEAKDILGVPPSEEEDELLQRAERRRLNRKHRSPYPYGKFHHDHWQAKIGFWEYYKPIWFKERYREKYGREPENEPIIRHESGGWSIHPDYREVNETKGFIRDADNAYRISKGLPLKGEGWDSQAYLRTLVKQVASPLQVLFEHSSEWLHPQRYDIFLPEVNVAIEYMGEQHYWAIEHFGGEADFKHRKRLDEKKRRLSKNHGITVIDWRYDEDINEAEVRRRLAPHLPPHPRDGQEIGAL